MKTKFKITILFLVGLSCCSFSIVDRDDYTASIHPKHKGVKKIVEKTHDRWKVISVFDRDGFVQQEINYYKKEMRSDYRFDYVITDTSIEIKRENIICADSLERYWLEKYDYNHLGQCYKRYYAFPFQKNDDGTVMFKYIFTFRDDFVYEDSLLVRYSVAGSLEEIKHGEPTRIITCKYNEKKQKIAETEIRGQYVDTRSYAYDESGRLTDYILETNHKEGKIVAFSDVMTWSREKRNKTHIRFSNFDKHGNWRKSYYITERGKFFRSKRKIQYW